VRKNAFTGPIIVRIVAGKEFLSDPTGTSDPAPDPMAMV
jgi:hypothetical protein